MLPGMCSPDLGLNIVDGFKPLSPKGDGLASVCAGCPGKALARGGPACPSPLTLQVLALIVFGLCLPLPCQSQP